MSYNSQEQALEALQTSAESGDWAQCDAALAYLVTDGNDGADASGYTPAERKEADMILYVLSTAGADKAPAGSLTHGLYAKVQAFIEQDDQTDEAGDAFKEILDL